MRKIAMAIGATLAITYVVAFSIYGGEAGAGIVAGAIYCQLAAMVTAKLLGTAEMDVAAT